MVAATPSTSTDGGLGKKGFVTPRDRTKSGRRFMPFRANMLGYLDQSAVVLPFFGRW